MRPFRAQTLDTPDGPFTIIEDAGGVVVASGWDDDVAAIVRRGGLDDSGDLDEVARCRSGEAVWAYYDGDPAAVAGVAVAPRGTPFQIAVWEHLRRIAAGTSATYGQVAEAVGRPGAARAVAGACARNPCGLFVPCHRVVAAGGGLAGFAWGLPIKASLLRREAGKP